MDDIAINIIVIGGIVAGGFIVIIAAIAGFLWWSHRGSR